jgi:ArsR family transcriptional regulator
MERQERMVNGYGGLARLFKALAHPVRLHILHVLRDGDQYVDHLSLVLDCRQANVSQHLALLQQAGLVEGRREGNRVCYRLPNEKVARLLELLTAIAQEAPIPKARAVWARCSCPRCQRRRARALTVTAWLVADDCGHREQIAIAWVGEGQVCLSITGTCASALNLGKALPPLDVADELSRPLNETRIYSLATDYLCRPSCLVPAALLGMLRVVAGLSAPSESRIACYRTEVANDKRRQRL